MQNMTEKETRILGDLERIVKAFDKFTNVGSYKALDDGGGSISGSGLGIAITEARSTIRAYRGPKKKLSRFKTLDGCTREHLEECVSFGTAVASFEKPRLGSRLRVPLQADYRWNYTFGGEAQRIEVPVAIREYEVVATVINHDGTLIVDYLEVA